MFTRASFWRLENDVFASYAHAGNSEGWVDQFHERLLNRLRELERRAPFSVWRDPKLSGADVFTDEIERRLESSGALISILPPNGLESGWCERERERFKLSPAAIASVRKAIDFAASAVPIACCRHPLRPAACSCRRFFCGAPGEQSSCIIARAPAPSKGGLVLNLRRKK